MGICLHEDVSQDPDGSHGGRDIQPHESREADLLAARLDPHDVVLALQRELLAADDKVDVGQTGRGNSIMGEMRDLVIKTHLNNVSTIVQSGFLTTFYLQRP